MKFLVNLDFQVSTFTSAIFERAGNFDESARYLLHGSCRSFVVCDPGRWKISVRNSSVGIFDTGWNFVSSAG